MSDQGTQLAKDIEQANQYLRTMMNKFIQTPPNGDPSAVAEAKVAVAEAKVEVAKQEVAVTEANVARARQSGGPAAIAEAKVAVAEAKVEVAKQGVEVAKQGVAVAEANVARARQSGDPAAIAEAKVAVAEAKVEVAEAKVEVAKQGVAVAEANVARARQSGDPAAIADAKASLEDARQWLKLVRDVYEAQTRAGSVGAAASQHRAEAVVSLQALATSIERMAVDIQTTKAAATAAHAAASSLLSSQQASPLSDATVGRNAREELRKQGLWDVLSHDESKAAVMTKEALSELRRKLRDLEGQGVSSTKRERHLVSWLTPHFRRLVSEASAGALLFVNSENHEWLQMTEQIRDRYWRPDAVVLPPEAMTWKQTPADIQFSGENSDFLFGGCADPALYDSVVAMLEAKAWEGPEEWVALGQTVRYAEAMWVITRAINERRRTQGGVALSDNLVDWKKVVAFDINRFLLVKCCKGGAVHCTEGTWTDGGSAGAITSFFRGPKQPWDEAVGRLCIAFGVKVPLCRENQATAFLGCGLHGKVFRVVKTGDTTEYALKVGLGTRGEADLNLEALRFSQFQESRTEVANCVAATVTSSELDTGCSGLLISPVGSSLPRKRYALRSALNGLIHFARMGWRHGDARHQNVVWCGVGEEGHAMWVDYRTLAKQPDFRSDFEQFAKSFDITVDIGVLPDTADVHVDILVQHLSPVWQPRGSGDGN